MGRRCAARALASILTIYYHCDRCGYGCGRWLWSVVVVGGCDRWLGLVVVVVERESLS